MRSNGSSWWRASRPRSRWEYRAAASRGLPEEAGPYGFRQGIVEILAYANLAAQQAELARLEPGAEGDQACERTAGFGDDDLLATGGATDQLGELGFGFVEVDRGHGFGLDQGWSGLGHRSGLGQSWSKTQGR